MHPWCALHGLRSLCLRITRADARTWCRLRCDRGAANSLCQHTGGLLYFAVNVDGAQPAPGGQSPLLGNFACVLDIVDGFGRPLPYGWQRSNGSAGCEHPPPRTDVVAAGLWQSRDRLLA
jgi:hypothetical protein